MTLDEIRARAPRVDRARMAATTEAAIARQALEDGHDAAVVPDASEIISPGFIRRRLGLSQAAFARLLGIPVGTLRNWEQNRVAMEPAVRALMRIIAREPEAALRALVG